MNRKSIALTLPLLGLLVSASAHAQDTKTPMKMKEGIMMARYGGPSYDGKPALNVTASLVEAGGGPENFSIATALTNMVGADLVKAEVEKLTKQYG